MYSRRDILLAEEGRPMAPQPVPVADTAPSAPHVRLNQGYAAPYPQMVAYSVEQNAGYASMSAAFHHSEHPPYPNQPHHRHRFTSPNGGMALEVQPTEFQHFSPNANTGYTYNENNPIASQQEEFLSHENRFLASDSGFNNGSGVGGGSGVGRTSIGGVDMDGRMNGIGGIIDTSAGMSSSNWGGHDATSPGTQTGAQARAFIVNPSVPGFAALRCGWIGCERRSEFSSTSALTRHLMSFHVEPYKYQCCACSKTDGRLDKIKEHVVKCPFFCLQISGTHGT